MKASGPNTSWQIDREKMETVTDFIFLGSKITTDSDCSHEIKMLTPLRKAMTNLQVKVSLSCVQFFVTLWTVACQTSLSMGFSRQEYWSGLPFPSPGDLPDPGINPGSPTLPAGSLPSEPPEKPHDKPRQHIKNQRHLFADKDLYSQKKQKNKKRSYSQCYGFSSNHVQM